MGENLVQMYAFNRSEEPTWEERRMEAPSEGTSGPERALAIYVSGRRVTIKMGICYKILIIANSTDCPAKGNNNFLPRQIFSRICLLYQTVYSNYMFRPVPVILKSFDIITTL